MRADEILLLDMLLAAREAVAFVSGFLPQEFEQDRMRQLAVIKSIEIVGEAAAKVSEEFRTTHPEVPWREITGMRHRLIHAYFEVNLSKVWETVKVDLPRLIGWLEPLVPPEEP